MSPLPPLHQEIEDLVALLRDHAAPPPAAPDMLIWQMASACVMGQRHLWEDMGLHSRAALTELMSTHFPRLKALNAHNMRWKKFLFRMLCERAEIPICRSPTCEACDEQALCFPGDGN